MPSRNLSWASPSRTSTVLPSNGNGNGGHHHQVIPWGLRDLDWRIGTGFVGRAVVVGARPSNGKSTFMLNWVNRIYESIVSEKHRVLCFWTEHTMDVAYLTWACLRVGVPLDPVIKGQWGELPAGTERRIATELHLLRGWSFTEAAESEGWVEFSSHERPTVSQIVAEVERLQPDVLVLDYIQRVRPEGQQTKFEAIAEAGITVRQLAIQKPLLAVVGSQLKRRGDGVFDKYRPPYLEDFKGAGEIEEVANVALGLFRPLKRMTIKEERAVKSGELDLDAWKIPGAMAIKVLKHHYWPDAADRIIRVECRDGQIRDWQDGNGFQISAPLGAGDAYEPGDDRAPF